MSDEKPQDASEDGIGQSASTAGLEAKRFPVLRPPTGCTDWVPWAALDEAWAMRIHNQTLARLAQRGGLCPDEIFINRHHLKYLDKVPTVDAIALCNELASNAIELTGALKARPNDRRE